VSVDPSIYAPFGGGPGSTAAGAPAQRTPPDIRPPGERDQDEELAGVERGLLDEPARPLTDEEREAAARDPGVAPRVYAPASERVPKPPAPGHEDLAGQVDEDTPERQAQQATDRSS